MASTIDFASLLHRRQTDDNPPLVTGGSDGTQVLLNALSDPFSSSLQTQSIWIAAATSLGVMAGICLIFSLIRPYNASVYAPKTKHADRRHAPPSLDRGFFSWFKPIAQVKEAELVDKLGLDATVFLRFTRMLRNMFLALSVVGCGILIPVHMTSTVQFSNSQSSIKDGDLANSTTFQNMTPQGVSGNALWSHVVVAWAFTAIIFFFIWFNYRAVARLKRTYFLTSDFQKSLHARSIWITDIAPADRTEEGVLRVVDAVDQTESIPRTAIARNVKDLPKLIHEHDEAVVKLEGVLAKYLKNPDNLPARRPTYKPSKLGFGHKGSKEVDAIDFLTNQIQELEIRIRDVRSSVDTRNPMAVGFASFEHIEEASRVAYKGRRVHPNGADVHLAPRPNDLIWDNLALSKSTRKSRRFMNDLWVSLLTLVWIVPNALIAIFLTNLANLRAISKSFDDVANRNTTLWAVIQAILSPAILSLVYIVLPILFRRMATRAGDLTKTYRERHVMQKLYAFFVFNNLIVFSLFSTMWRFATTIINETRNGKDPWSAISNQNLPRLILVSLCSVSAFWVTWLLQRNLGAAIDLAQLINLAYKWFARRWMSPTPRQAIEWTAPPWFDYASYYNYFLFYATVALCFATVQPLVLPITAFYFLVDAWLKKYLLLYVFITKNESGGQFWHVLINRLLFATALANVVAALVVKGGTWQAGDVHGWIMFGCIMPLPFFSIFFKLYLQRAFADRCKFYHLAITTDPERTRPTLPDASNAKKERRQDRVAARFGHPALYKPLITPMVHARAKDALTELYRGRLDADVSHGQYGYSDIAMGPMSEQQPGKTAAIQPLTTSTPPGSGVQGPHQAADLFEVIPESELDFGFFKDRPDFRDEHGGSGELYGRPADLISERSRTPRSFSPDAQSTLSDAETLRSADSSPTGRPRIHRGSSSYSTNAIERRPVPARYTSATPPPLASGSGLRHGNTNDLYGDAPNASAGNLYATGTNDSRRNLLSNAQPNPYTASSNAQPYPYAASRERSDSPSDRFTPSPATSRLLTGNAPAGGAGTSAGPSHAPTANTMARHGSPSGMPSRTGGQGAAGGPTYSLAGWRPSTGGYMGISPGEDDADGDGYVDSVGERASGYDAYRRPMPR